MKNEKKHEKRRTEEGKDHLGGWTYDGYERKSISLPLLVAAETKM